MEIRELVSRFWLWQVKDLDEAVAWAKRCPNGMPSASKIEIPIELRPVFEAADFGEALTRELAAQEERPRASSKPLRRSLRDRRLSP